MAQIYKRKGSPHWYGKFQFAGTTYRFSTGKNKRSDAEEVLRRKVEEVRGDLRIDELIDHLLTAVDGLPPQKQDDCRSRIAEQLLRANHRKLQLGEAWETWLMSPRKRNPGENTLAGYRAIWKRFRAWMETRGSGAVFLHEIDPETVEAYATDLWGSNLSSRTYNAHITFLKAMFNTLKVTAGIGNNVWEDLPRMQGRTESRRNLTEQELTEVIGKAGGSLRLMLLIGVYTGMRLGDVCLLEWRCVDFRRGMIEYVPLKTRRTNKTVTVPMHPVISEALRAWENHGGSDFVFPVEAELYRRDRQAITRRFNRHFDACGITTTEKPPANHRRRAISRVGFHSLRHSFVSLCAAGGVPQAALMELVGHGSPAMTRLYSHAGDDQKSRAVLQLPCFDDSFSDSVGTTG